MHIPFCSTYLDIIAWMKNVVFLYLALSHRLEQSTHNKWTQMVNISTRCCWKMNVSRKCEENVLFPPSCGKDTWHVARVWVFAHSPNNCRECGGRYTGKYYSWRDYLESVLSILWWTLATTLCAPHWELWLPGNTQQIQHKKYYTTLKNIWLPMLLRERWRSGTEDVMRGSRQRCSGVTGTATTVTGLQPRDNCSAPT